MVLLFYLVSGRISLFSFRLDPELPVFSHLQFHLPRAGLGFQLFTLCFQLLRGLLGFELSVLTWQIYLVHCIIARAFSVLSSGTHFTNLCLYHPIPGMLSTFSQKPKVICMILESTTFLPMEESLLATCRGPKFSAEGQEIPLHYFIMNPHFFEACPAHKRVLYWWIQRMLKQLPTG